MVWQSGRLHSATQLDSSRGTWALDEEEKNSSEWKRLGDKLERHKGELEDKQVREKKNVCSWKKEVNKEKRKEGVAAFLFFAFTSSASGFGKLRTPQGPVREFLQTCLLQEEFTDSPRINRRSAVHRSSSGVSGQQHILKSAYQQGLPVLSLIIYSRT